MITGALTQMRLSPMIILIAVEFTGGQDDHW